MWTCSYARHGGYKSGQMGRAVTVHTLGDSHPLLLPYSPPPGKAGELGGWDTGDWRESVLISDSGNTVEQEDKLEPKNGDAWPLDIRLWNWRKKSRLKMRCRRHQLTCRWFRNCGKRASCSVTVRNGHSFGGRFVLLSVQGDVLGTKSGWQMWSEKAQVGGSPHTLNTITTYSRRFFNLEDSDSNKTHKRNKKWQFRRNYRHKKARTFKNLSIISSEGSATKKQDQVMFKKEKTRNI